MSSFKTLSEFLNEPEEPEGPKGLSDIFVEEPVDLTTFIQDKKFLGQTNIKLSYEQSRAIQVIERIYYPDLYPLMAEEFEFGEYWGENVPSANLITLQWGKGSGKDAICRWASLRVAYLLLCLKSPQLYFEMPETDSIHLLNIAANAPQANRAFFKPMTTAVKNGWFKGKAIIRQGEIEYDKNIFAVSGHSDAEGQEGLNIMLGVADEIDAFKAKDEMVGTGKKLREASTSAESILDMLKTSASTRFPKTYKRVAISYPRYLGSTIQQLTTQGRASNEKYGEKSIHYVSGPLATWEVNPRVSGKEDFFEDYEEDPVGSAAKYECKPSRAIDPFFRNMEIFRLSVDSERMPLTVDYKPVNYYSKHYHRNVRGWEPIFHFDPDFKPIQGARYALHGDLAIKGDRAGIAMSHVEKWEHFDATLVDDEGATYGKEFVRPIIRNDFTIAFEAKAEARDLDGTPLPREIQIRWVRMLADELQNRGFVIGMFTFDSFQCLSGDTRIPLLDGTTKTMEELDGQSDFWVYSVDAFGRIVPGHVSKARKTGYRHDMLEVVLDNGEVVKATSDHRFMLRDGTYREARELSPEDSLMPLYRRMRKTSPSSKEYEQVWNPEPDDAGRRWKFTHSVVSHDQYGKLPKGYVTHHIDHSKTNNSPENLVQLTNEEHYLVHTKALNLDTFRKLWTDPEWRKSHIERISKAQSKAQRGKTGKSSRRYRHDVSFEDIQRTHKEILSSGQVPSKERMCTSLGITQGVLYGRVAEHGFSSWKSYRDAHEEVSEWALYMRDWKRQKSANNHQVLEVRPASAEWVYDLQVDEHHNFATEAGVFVHNSADTIQIFTSQGIESDKMSTDRDPSLWGSLKDVASEGRLRMPFDQLLMNELEALSRLDNGKIDHPPNGCFVGETRIPLLDGTYPQISELAGQQVWVYSADDNGKIKPGLARGRMTKTTTDLVDVILDNGYVARCTPEHLWMLRDGSYREAQELRPGIDRLMPITFNWPVNGGYTRLTDKDGVRTLDNNHKVREVVRVTLEEPVPVFDLEVDEWNNFALSGGVFVHNSKDLSDAFCCSVVGAITVGGEEDPEGAIVELGGPYFDTGGALAPLEGMDDIIMTVGNPLDMPLGFPDRGTYGW